MQYGSPPQHMELQAGRSFSTPGRGPPPPQDLGMAGTSPTLQQRESPTSSGLRSGSDTADFSENARLVSSALSDDGMTPLIQPPRSRGARALLFCRRVLSFLLAHWSKAAILGVLITLIVLISVKGFGFFGNVLSWFQRHNGWAGWGIFVGMYTVVVSLFLPGVVLILGAGFVFGFWRGLLAVWAGGAVGQALAFLLARYLFHSWVENTLKQKWAKWAIIDKAIEHDGWKLVLILRFSPIIPYNLLNIAMATTSIPFWQFTIVSAVGIIYECAVFAYFGSMADNIHAIISGEGGPPPVFQWVMLGISAVMCVVGALFVSYSIKRSVKRAQGRMSNAEIVALGLEHEEGGGAQQDEEMGGQVRLHSSYPASLEREGFVGSSSGYNLVGSGSGSPEFELKAVTGSRGSSRGGNGSGGGAAEAARDKARLLANGSGGGGSSSGLALMAASGSGTLQASLGPLGQVRSGGGKAKVSPTHSSSGAGQGGAEEGELARKATRRHPSIGGESAV